MNRKTTKTIYEGVRYALSTKASASPELIYFRICCPHCDYDNVIARGFMQKKMLGLSSKCRRIIIVENYRELTSDLLSKKDAA